jgi:hypothetical protein
MGRWALLVADKGGAVVPAVWDVVARLRASGLRVAGLLQNDRPFPEGGSTDELVRLSTGESVMVGGHGSTPTQRKDPFCSFLFDSTVFALARRWLEEDLAAGVDVLVLHKVSKMEVAGDGHHGTVGWALQSFPGVVVLCVRADQLFNVMERFHLDEPAAYVERPLEDSERIPFAEAVRALVA